MFGTGQEQIEKPRLSHMILILEDLAKRKGSSTTTVVNSIERKSENLYEVSWQHTDHFGGEEEYTFEDNKIIKITSPGKWMS